MSVLVIGSCNVDLSVSVSMLPKKGETLLGQKMSYSFGGKGANQAVACGKLGADVTFLSCVGNDEHGQEIRNYLESVNVRCDRMKVSHLQPTGTAIITVDNEGQNTIVVIAGANSECDIDYLKENEDAFQSCDYVLLQMEIPLDAIEYAIACASKYNKKVVLNPAPALSNFNELLYPKIDYLTPNETELEIMAQSNHTMDDNIQSLLNRGVKNILVTVGESGAYFVNRQVKQLVETTKVVAIDTVGAGDCFNGAFVTALSQGMSDLEAIRFANKAAAIAVTRQGAQESIPTREEMNN